MKSMLNHLHINETKTKDTITNSIKFSGYV